MTEQMVQTRTAHAMTHPSFPIATVFAGVVAPARPTVTCRDLYRAYRKSLDRALTALAAGNEGDYELHFDITNALGWEASSQLCFRARD